MTSEGASAVLGADVSMNPGASMTPFTTLPFPQLTIGPEQRPPAEQLPLPVTTPSFPPGFPPALPGLPSASLAARDAGRGLIGTGACNIMDQVRSEVGQPQPPHRPETIILTQAPLNESAPGALCGGAVCPAPPFLEASAVETILSTLALGSAPASKGGWYPSLPPPQVPPTTAQLASIIPPVNAWPQLPGASGKGGLATSQSKTLPDDIGNPKSTYEDFQRWRRFKVLARGHLPQSPDAEALSCFLIPVLRSLSHLKPTMTLEEGIGQAMQEWDRKSNYDRMTYYEMAEMFMDLEAEEEMQIQKSQLMKGAQGLCPAAPPRPDPQGPPALVVGPQPVCIPMEDVPRVQATCRPQGTQETETSDEIPPEAVQEYMDIMDELEGLAHSATGDKGGEREEDRKELQQGQDETYLDLGLLNYIEYLCYQDDYVTKMEAIPDQLLKQVVSIEAMMDFLPEAEKMAQQLGLPPVQLVEERVLSSKVEEGVQAPPSHGAPQLDSGRSESATSQDAQRCVLGPQLVISDRGFPPETDFEGRQRRGGGDAHLTKPKDFAVSSGHQECPPLRAPCLSLAPQVYKRAYCRRGPRAASTPRETSLVRESLRPVGRSSENEEDLPSLAFLMASPKNLLPCTLSLSPVSASGLACPGGRGRRPAAQAQAQKRKGDQCVPGNWRKRHCSYYGTAPCPSYCQPQTRWGCPDQI